MVASRLHVLSVYGIAVITVIGAIPTGLASNFIREAVLAVVVLILGILLFVGLIMSNRRIVLAYLIAHTVVLIIATISQIVLFVKAFIETNVFIESFDIHCVVAIGIILIDWIFLTIVGLYYRKVFVCSDPGKGYTKCVEESLIEKTPED